jgi:hypothetical protein
VQVVGTSICHIEEARIAEEWTYYDALGLMQQLGAVNPLRRAVTQRLCIDQPTLG